MVGPSLICGIIRERSIDQVADLEHVVCSEPPTRLQRVLSKSYSGKPLIEINDKVEEDSRSLVRQISLAQRPVVMRRESISAVVNIGAALEQGSQRSEKSFRRLTSQKSLKGMLPVSDSESLGSRSQAELYASGPTAADPFASEAESRTSTVTAADAQGLAGQGSTDAPARPSARRLSMTKSRRMFENRLQRELRQKSAGIELDLNGHTRLQERLRRLELLEHEQRGDGNCQFRAISHQLYDTPTWHMSVRKQVVKHMKEQSEYFEAFLGEEFDAYCREMGQDGSWGDELTLRAATDSFGLKINVITSDSENWYMVYEPELTKLNKEIFVSYISPIHYNSLSRK